MANRFACELRGGGVGEEAAARREGVIVRALARAPRRVPACAARPPPGPAPPTGRQRRGGPLEACWEMAAGAAGAWVPSGRLSKPRSAPKEKPRLGPQYPGRRAIRRGTELVFFPFSPPCLETKGCEGDPRDEQAVSRLPARSCCFHLPCGLLCLERRPLPRLLPCQSTKPTPPPLGFP
ncbi:atherin-like [Trachypithecus francoisi]|uniref:atherin-like n=1 Tax=Trachypithecus francoisi TaxID=54180 RepID=UPI00141BCC34|nr:atherin-like [Trachypithecus francoisi]